MPIIHYNNIYVSITRLIVFLILTSSVSFIIYLTYVKEWKMSPKYDTFNIHDCNTLNITRDFLTGVSWEDVLKSSEHTEYIFKINNTTITYYVSEVFKVIPKGVFRSLTYGLINLNPYIINIKADCIVSKSVIKKMFNEIGKYGVIYDDKLSYKITLMPILLFSINGIVGLILTVYFIYFSYNTIMLEWNNATTRFGKKYFKDAYDKNTFNDNRMEACGPFFLLEHINGNPSKNTNSFLYGIIGTISHNVFFNILLLPFIFFIYFTDLKTVSLIAYVITCIYQFVILLYGSMYYINVSWKYRKYVSYLMYCVITITLFLSSIFIVNTFLWFIFSISVSPYKATSILMTIVTILYYISYTYTQLKTYQNYISSYYENDDDIPSDDELVIGKYDVESQKTVPHCRKMLKMCKLTTGDIYMKLIAGTSSVVLIAIWVILIWVNIGVSSNNFSSFITTLIVPLSALYNKVNSINGVKEKLTSYGFSENIDLSKSRRNSIQKEEATIETKRRPSILEKETPTLEKKLSSNSLGTFTFDSISPDKNANTNEIVLRIASDNEEK